MPILRFALAICLLLPLSAVQALDRGLSGLWFNPAQSGHGFEFTVIGERSATVTWYTYTPQGAPLWLGGVLEEDSNGELRGQVFAYEGMRFGVFDPAANRQQAWGSLSVRFTDCSSGRVDYSSTLSSGGQSYGNGSIPIARLVGVSGLACGASALSGAYYGYFRSTALGVSSNAYVLLEAGGEFTVFGIGLGAYFGSYTFNNGTGALGFNANGFSVPGVTFPTGSSTATLQGSGTARAGDFLRGSYSGSGDSGTLSLWLISESTRSVALSALAGSYTDTDVSSGLNATITAAGDFTGRDRQGCDYNGRLTALGQPGNAFGVAVTVSNCGALNGSHTGRALVVDNTEAGDNQGFLITIRAATNAVVALLRKN